MTRKGIVLAICLLATAVATANTDAPSKNTKENDRFLLFGINRVGYTVRENSDSVSANSYVLRAGIEQWFTLPYIDQWNIYAGVQGNIATNLRGGHYKEEGNYFNFETKEKMYVSIMADAYLFLGYRDEKFTILAKAGRTHNSIRNAYKGDKSTIGTGTLEDNNVYLNGLGTGLEFRWHVRSGGSLILDYQTRYTDDTIYDNERKISSFGLAYAMPF